MIGTKSRTQRFFATIVLLGAVTNDGLATTESHHHDASRKTWYDLKLFESDIMPEYNQILQTYGANTAAELVENKVLTAPKHFTGVTSTTNSTLKRDYYHLWPKRVKDVTVIPYEFSEGAFNIEEQSIIEKAMQDLARQVNVVRFVHKSSSASRKNRNYLRFTADVIHRDEFVSADDIDCWSHVGWQRTSHNVINLGQDFCVATGIVWHLLLHTLGMWHTGSRWDRDDYVTIVWENVVPGREYNFRKRTYDDTLGFPYFDYGSIMNLDNAFYSKNGKDTVLSPEPIGQVDHLTTGDVLRVRLLYQCRSGPRMYDDYLAHPCTEDCPCWQDDSSSSIESILGNTNCHGNDAACQGNLFCSPLTDQCVPPSGDNNYKTETVTMLVTRTALVVPLNRIFTSSIALIAMTCFGAALSLSLMRAAYRRRGYENIP